MSETEGHKRFWEAAEAYLEQDGIEKSTMMGFPCLRVNGAYFGSVHKDGSGLVVKLSKTDVLSAVADGTGEHFAPNGKVFKEWLFVPVAQADTWSTWLGKAITFVKAA